MQPGAVTGIDVPSPGCSVSGLKVSRDSLQACFVEAVSSQ
jgi:hypothetical protein